MIRFSLDRLIYDKHKKNWKLNRNSFRKRCTLYCMNQCIANINRIRYGIFALAKSSDFSRFFFSFSFFFLILFFLSVKRNFPFFSRIRASWTEKKNQRTHKKNWKTTCCIKNIAFSLNHQDRHTLLFSYVVNPFNFVIFFFTCAFRSISSTRRFFQNQHCAARCVLYVCVSVPLKLMDQNLI